MKSSDPKPSEVSAATLAMQLGHLLDARGLTITTAESCTGGLVAAALTDIAGSSAWFHQGIVSYSNSAKTALLDVDSAIIDQYGAVSEQVVCAMAAGARALAGADAAIAISGIAGPGGGSAEKPVGTVWIGWSIGSAEVFATRYIFSGDRAEVRQAAVNESLRVTIHHLSEEG